MNILLTSIGRRNYVVDYFKRALHGIGKVIGSNSVPESSGMLVADRSYLSPPIISRDYIPFLLDLCLREKIRAVIPFLDMDVAALSLHKHEFEDQGVNVIVSDHDVIRKCFDKASYPEFLPGIGIMTPRLFTSLSEVSDKFARQEVSFPLFLKPRWGTGSRLTEKVHTPEELAFFHTLLTRRVAQTYNYTPVPDGMENQILIQEFIEGDEYGMDLINDLAGNHAGTYIKKKIGMRSGETDGATSILHHPFKEKGIAISEFLRHQSIIDVDFIETKEGDCYLLDINPRFGGGYPFTHQAGVDLPSCIVHWLNAEKPHKSLLDMKDNVTTVKGLSLHSIH